MPTQQWSVMERTPCENCGAPLKRYTEKCPQCKIELDYCRTCETPLVYGKHVHSKTKEAESVLEERNVLTGQKRTTPLSKTIDSTYTYTPCPLCETPRPFQRKKVKFFEYPMYGGIVLVVLLAALAVTLLVSFIIFLLWDSVFYDQLNRIKPFFLVGIGIALVHLFAFWFTITGGTDCCIACFQRKFAEGWRMCGIGRLLPWGKTPPTNILT
jgi:RNase P subunit RPR2